MVSDDPASPAASTSSQRARRIAFVSAALLLVVGAAYVVRCTLLLNVARIFLDQDAELVAQEKADGVAIAMRSPPFLLIKPQVLTRRAVTSEASS
jgi:hypothetical protein